MNVLVKTFDLKSGNQISTRLLIMTDYGSWSWISKQIAWACNNQHGLQITRAEDEILAQDMKLAA